MRNDESVGCACRGPTVGDNTPPARTDSVVLEPRHEGAETGSTEGSDSLLGWVPPSCELPPSRQPERAAEFDALFTAALRSFHEPEPTRLRLVLDPAWRDTARDLAERENQCCSLFTFVLQQRDDELWLDITVPADQRPVLEALARHAAATTPEGSP
ncbi:hypothetical protein SAMN04487819_102367 [Actinopolyspora alba]|uniref:Arsenate reductase n=1 Tax=Actinopolyspora alba TaxID=673379 RepID=A0A1I1UQQ6_9ACTN|nr:hypothetical protein [Actinopolyspora alba]SFD73116.1 hypothetical protein SAMN04487819_102367 [Actinopolyspora alba]